MNISNLEVSSIVEDTDQPRKHHDEEGLRGLADSIKQHGLLQPITVVPLLNVNMYKIVTGERRWRAAQLAGLDVIPCIVREVDPDEVLTQQLIENLQREDLQPLEKAQALTSVKARVGTTNRELAGRLGISERAIGYLLDLLDLPESISSQVVSSPNRPSDGQLTEKHARFLKQLNDAPDIQQRMVEKIREEKINGESTGKFVKALKNRPDEADAILDSPADHLIQFFRGAAPTESSDDAPEAPKQVHPRAQAVINILPIFDSIHPSNLSRGDVQQVLDALTSVKLAVDGLIRECNLELENAPA